MASISCSPSGASARHRGTLFAPRTMFTPYLSWINVMVLAPFLNATGVQAILRPMIKVARKFKRGYEWCKEKSPVELAWDWFVKRVLASITTVGVILYCLDLAKQAAGISDTARYCLINAFVFFMILAYVLPVGGTVLRPKEANSVDDLKKTIEDNKREMAEKDHAIIDLKKTIEDNKREMAEKDHAFDEIKAECASLLREKTELQISQNHVVGEKIDLEGNCHLLVHENQQMRSTA